MKKTILKKSLYFTVLITLIFTTKGYTQVYLSEGFENSGQKPNGWTNDSYVKPPSAGVNWRFQNGGHTTNPLIPLSGHPNKAHTGNYNAVFQFQSLNNEATKLISKPFNLEFAVKAELHFWHSQEEWYNLGSSKHDNLKVYYRKSSSQAWTLLASYNEVVTGWTKRVISLPESSYSSTCEIAFEGTTGSGWGVCIDDVSVIETALKDRQVDSVFFNQHYNYEVPSGTANNPIGVIGIKVSGNVGTIKLDELNITSKNTNDLDITAAGVKLFKTTSAVFNSKTPITTGSSFSSGVVVFSTLNSELQTGYNYIWVTYDINSNATPTDTLDFKIPIGGIKTSGLSYTPTTPSPSGFRTIRKSVFTDNFEGILKWSLTGEFEIGQPQGKGGSMGKPDPSSAQSGTKILGTDLTGLGLFPGDYESNLTKDQYTATLLNTLDLQYYKDVKLSMGRYLNADINDNVSIQISLDGGVTWMEKWSNQVAVAPGDTMKSGYNENDWNYFELLLPEFTKQSNVKIRFSVGKTDGSQNFSGWNIDDVAITANYLDKDVSVTEWISPLSGCNLGSEALVSIKIQNNAALATPAIIPVAYSTNNGVTWTQETLNESIPVGGSKVFTFSTKADLSVTGLYPKVIAKTILIGDKEPKNDQLTTSIFSAPTVLPPYNEPFTNNSGYWRPINSNLWEHGVLSGPLVHSNPSDKVWATSLSGTYSSIDALNIVSIFEDDFETNKGWTFSGEFERGSPSGNGGGVGSGNPDPYSAHSGTKVIGTDLTGIVPGTPFNYEPNISNANAYYATSPTIDLTNYRNVSLNYWRYLNVDTGDSIKIETSKNNGVTWTTLWKAGVQITDFSWNEVITQIPDSLINTSQFKIRFGLTYSNGGPGFSGWNIDDVSITGDIFSKDEAILESPCFNMTGLVKPIFQCDINHQTEKSIDGATLLYSIDNGTTWIPVGNNGDIYDSRWNWYKDSLVTSLGKDGWSGNSNGWKTVSHILPSAIANIPCVKFRIYFKCDQYNNNYAGIAIDNIKITEAPNDFGISALVSPATACYLSANEPIKVKIKNYGIRMAKIGESLGLSITINYNGVIQSSNQIVTLTSDLPVNNELSITSSSLFNFNKHGDFTIKVATTGEPANNFYSDISNDTLTTIVRVKGMPEFSLGSDIGTTTPSTIVLDAGPGMTSYKWQDNSTARTFNVVTYGTYTVIVTNSEGCTATDAIEVINSDKNAGVTTISGLVSSCAHTTSEKPTITIKNFGVNILPSGLSIPIGVKVNNVVVATDAVVLAADLLPNTTINYTLTAGIDLSAKGNNTVKIYTNLPTDADRSNDTLSTPANTHGSPTVNFALPVINTTNPIGTVLTAITSPNITLYSWKNETSGLPVGTNSISYTVETASSAVYSVTVKDVNDCGTTTASVQVNAKDLGISSIDGPLSSICANTPTPIKVTLKNYGNDIYASGTKVKLRYTTTQSSEEQEFTFSSALAPAEIVTMTFTNTVNFSSGTDFVKITSDINNDANSSNNELEKLISVTPPPTVDIELDTLFMVFGPTDTYTISPNYSADVTSYEWQDFSHNRDYYIYGYPSSKYKVVGKTSLGCESKDSLVIVSNDLALTAITSPTSKCVLEDNTSIITTITNRGNTTYTAGTKITLFARLNGTAFLSEEYTFSSDLAPQTSIDYTLTQKANLAGMQNFLIEITMVEPHDFILDNNTVSRTGNAIGFPTALLGLDQEVHAWEKILNPGNFKTYIWQDNSNKPTFTAKVDGKYSVTVTDYFGCSAYAEVNLTFIVDDIALVSLDNPKNANSCSLTSAEPVTITVKNTGTVPLPMGQQFTVKYTINGNTTNEVITLASQLLPNATRQITLGTTLDFTVKKAYPFSISVEMAGDIQPNNDIITTTINAYQPVLVNLGADIVQVDPPATLYAGNGQKSYLWNTGATSADLVVTASGNYSVTVTSFDGCTATDEVNVRFTSQTLSVIKLETPSTQCLTSVPIPVKFKIKNNGVSLLPSGTAIPMSYIFNSAPEVSETLVLSSDLAAGAEQTLVFTQKVIMNIVGNNKLRITLYKGLPEEKTSEDIFTGLETPTFSFTKKVLDVTGFPYLITASGGNSYLWSNGSTTPSTNVNAAGKYWVKVIGSNTCFVSDTIVITNTTSVGEDKFITLLKYYPVPASYELNVETTLKSTTNVTIEILDITGVVRWRKSYGLVTELAEKIVLNDLMAGTYILRISTSEGSSSNTFIINR